MKKLIPVLVALCLMIVIGLTLIGKEVVDRYSYSKERVDMDAYYNVSGDKCAIIYEDNQIEEYALVKDGLCYMKLEDVHTYLNKGFYYDSVEELLLYTEADGTNIANINGREYTKPDGSVVTLPYEAWMKLEDTCYISMEYVKLFTNFTYAYYENHLEMKTSFPDTQIAYLERDTQVRLRGGVKSPVMREVAQGEKVTVLEVMENWCKVKTSDAIIGYVELKYMTEPQTEEGTPVKHYEKKEFEILSMDGKVCLGWHAIGGAGGNTTLDGMAKEGTAMNVIAPTWFSITSEEGEYRSFGEASYVNRAHDKGLSVWGVWDDFNYANENGISIDMKKVLEPTTQRTRLVGSIVSSALELGLDGVNIDFEKLSSGCSEAFAQFLRELSVECHRADLLLSVDNYVPFHFNEYYRLDVQGEVVDYVIIMGYDEHWHGSKDPGSVASLSYVTNGIQKTLEKVKPEKVINALPFYTIMWTTEGTEVTDEYLTLNNTADFLDRIGKEPVWDETNGQNYLEWESGSKLYQIWLEDNQSIQEKLNAMSSYKIGGVAVWRLGYGTPEVWELLKLYMEL